VPEPRYEELVARLTAAGSPFEIATEDVGGRPLKVFRNRERSLREKLANAAAPARRQRLPGSGRAPHPLCGVRSPRLGCRPRAHHAARAREGRPPGDPLHQLSRLADRPVRRDQRRRHRRGPERLVGHGGDRVRPHRLGQPLPGGGREALPARRAAAREASPAGEGVLRRCRGTRRHASHRRPDRAPRGAAGDAPRRGRSVRPPLHLRHDRTLQGLHHHPPRHHRAGDGHPVRERDRLDALGQAAGGRRRSAPAGGAAHLAAVPRGRPALERVPAPHDRLEARVQRGTLRCRAGDAAHRARADHDLGRDPDHAAPRGPPPQGPPVRPLHGPQHLVRWRAHPAGDDREGPRGASRGAFLRQRLRAHGDARGRHRERRQGPARPQDLDRPPPAHPLDEDRGRGRQGGARRQARRAADPGPHHHPGLLEPPGRHRRDRPRRMAAHGRPRLPRRRGLLLRGGPCQGHDPARWRERVLHGDREHPGRPPGDRRGGGGGRTGCGAGRAGEGDRAARARLGALRERGAPPRRRASRELQGARVRGVRGTIPCRATRPGSCSRTC
jgi:hypothetical protein